MASNYLMGIEASIHHCKIWNKREQRMLPLFRRGMVNIHWIYTIYKYEVPGDVVAFLRLSKYLKFKSKFHRCANSKLSMMTGSCNLITPDL